MGDRTCSIEGCGKRAYGHGWCRNHHASWARNGDPLASDLRRLRSTVTLARQLATLETDECIAWPHPLVKGYGQLWDGGKKYGAHAFVLMLRAGPCPPGMEAAHSCGNRSCVNYRHLRWDTPKGNAADRLAHDTHLWGERHPRAKLTDVQAAEIRARYAAGTFDGRGRRPTQYELAAEYGVSQPVIGHIVRGLKYRQEPKAG